MKTVLAVLFGLCLQLSCVFAKDGDLLRERVRRNQFNPSRTHEKRTFGQGLGDLGLGSGFGNGHNPSQPQPSNGGKLNQIGAGCTVKSVDGSVSDICGFFSGKELVCWSGLVILPGVTTGTCQIKSDCQWLGAFSHDQSLTQLPSWVTSGKSIWNDFGGKKQNDVCTCASNDGSKLDDCGWTGTTKLQCYAPSIIIPGLTSGKCTPSFDCNWSKTKSNGWLWKRNVEELHGADI